MQFLLNTWYAVAWKEQLANRPLGRTVASQHLLLYRRKDGSPAALADTCPHRFAPLSAGRLENDIIECPYHGLKFDSAGRCVFNPHGAITPRMAIRSYPVIERHGIIWAWMGDTELADETCVPDLGFMDESSTFKTVHNYFGVVSYRFDILIDNLLDLSHEDFLHRGSFSGGVGEPAELRVREEGRMVVIERLTRNMPKRPRYEYIGERVDVKYTIRWWPSQVVAFERIYSSSDDPNGPSFTARFCHLATPAALGATHYFHAVTRADNLADTAVDARISEIAGSVILGEDGPMLEAIDSRMAGADLMKLRPVILPTDLGAMRVRKIMRRLLAREA